MSDTDSSGKKDLWDKLNAGGSFFSGVVLGIVSLAIGYLYHLEEIADRSNQSAIAQRQHEDEENRAQAQHDHDTKLAAVQNQYNANTQRLSVMAQLIPLLRAGGTDKEAAIALVSYYGDAPMKLQISSIYPDNPVAAAAASQSLDAAAVISPTSRQIQTNNPANNEGWIYLGEYRAQANGPKLWMTRYLDFPNTDVPAAIKGKLIKVREETGALYVRSGIPGQDGSLAPATGGLQSGQQVCVRDVQQWQQSGFMWANVQPVDAEQPCKTN